MKEKLVVHDGNFHTDDVFAVAFLMLLRGAEYFDVIRSRDEALIAEADWVVDVGGTYDHKTRRYDHHQNGAPVRDTGVPYSAFGLLWKHYGVEWCGSETVAKRIEEKLVVPIDANDNGITICTNTLPNKRHRIITPAQNGLLSSG